MDIGVKRHLAQTQPDSLKRLWAEDYDYLCNLPWQGNRATGMRVAAKIELDNFAMCTVGATDSLNLIILLQ